MRISETDIETLLSWTNMARNCLQIWNGFSSHRLVFGTNPKPPGILTVQISALDGTIASGKFANHLNVLHASRRASLYLVNQNRSKGEGWSTTN